jgi:membrane protein
MFAAFRHLPLSWGELLKRTITEANDDDIFGLAAQLAYYFFLALFPAVLFLLALASFFPLTNITDDIVRLLRPIAAPEVLTFLTEQLTRISNADSGGLLTLGIVGAIWSSSAAVVAIINSLNRAYDIEEGRPWWKVRVIALGLTIALALFIILSFTLVVAGPTLAEHVAQWFGLGAAFEWTWKILQWPLAFALVSTALGLVYYFAPDAEQDWLWITPGALVGTLIWVVVSLGFKIYVSNFADYNAAYGAVGGVIVVMLWFYLSGLAILVGAELNAEIEHASPHGKAPGEKVPGEKKKIGVAAARDYRERMNKAAAARPPEAPAAAYGINPSYVTSRMERSTMASSYADERTLGEMFAELSRDMRAHLQHQVQLAKNELSDKASKAGRSATFIGAGIVMALGGFLAIVAAVVLGLIALGLLPWAAALISGVLFAGIGYLVLRSGMSGLSAEELKPQQTIDAVKEDAAEVSEQIGAIRERLRPSYLMSEAKETVREKTVDRVKDMARRARTEATAQAAATRATVMYTARTSPLPMGIVGVAATWLLFRVLRRPRMNRRPQAIPTMAH